MSKSPSQPKPATARTTTVHITAPGDFARLQQAYQLVYYPLPEGLVTSRDKARYGRLHNDLREQLEAPYKIFTYDRRTGQRRWALYVLYPEPETSGIPDLVFEGEPLTPTKLTFNEVDLHLLVKLLQISYFRRQDKGSRQRFIGQDKCYIYARRREESEKYHICLEIELKGDLNDPQTFYVYGKAQTFARQEKRDPKYIASDIYFSLSDNRDGMAIFSPVKRSQVTPTTPLYVQRTFDGDRTTLDFHSEDDVEQTRGYLVDTFIRGFSQHLTGYGFNVEHIARTFERFPDPKVPAYNELPFDRLQTIYVYDCRFNRQHDLQEYLVPFQEKASGVTFHQVDIISADCTTPVLVIEDCEGAVFEEGKPLHGTGRVDPHELLYKQTPWVAKQFINVNDNIPGESPSADDYLNYELDVPDDIRITMALNQLYLKHTIMHVQDVSSRIPLTPVEWVFVHKETRGRGTEKQPFEVALYFENGTARFLNLNVIEDRDIFLALTERLGVDWWARCEEMREWYKKTGDNQDLPSFDVILGPDLFVEIQDAHEALLYEYEEIVDRLEQFTHPFAPDELKLAQHYDRVRGKTLLSEDMLYMKGLIAKRGKPLRQPKTRQERDSVKLHNSLHEYDAWLDDLKTRYPLLSFHRLTKEEDLFARVVALFESRRKLQNIYKILGKFEGPREAEVIPIYQGIWWEPQEFRYVVGSTSSIRSIQANAHRVRRFQIYQGKDNFDIAPFLDSMRVTFVRLNQYTVYPYYFHLIDLFIDNVLVYQKI